MALSTAEAEYMATSTATREAIWLRKLLAGLFGQIPRPTMIHCDNQSCTQMSVNLVFHDKTKHREIRYHYICDMVRKGVVELQYVPVDDQTADVLTKPLLRTNFEQFRRRLGVESNASLVERKS